MDGKNKGKGESRNSNVMCDAFGTGSPRNTAFSLDEDAGVSGENGVNFPDRGVLIPKEMLRQNGRKVKPWRKSESDDCSCVIDTLV